MKKGFSGFTIILCFVTGIIFCSINTSCKKTIFSTSTDTPPPPPPPPIDTISYVKKIEETFLQSNPAINRRTRDYNFYFDAQKRVVRVGIKNYGPVLYDSLTTIFSYNGTSQKPYSAILANVTNSSISGPAYYDTLYFTYDGSGKLIKDSTNELFYNFPSGLYTRTPLIRIYSYPGGLCKADWYWVRTQGGSPVLARTDTIGTDSTKITNLKTVFFSLNPAVFNYALGEAFIASAIVNPLSKLNISGMPFSYMYSSTKNEILGNSNHYIISGTNILAYYLDFMSPKLPSQFHLTPRNSNDVMLGSQSQFFSTEITPWTLRTKYPELMKVSATTSLPGDKFQYQYYYY